VREAPRNIRTVLMAPFASQWETTFYTRNGDVFAWICVIISVLAVVARARVAPGGMVEVRPA